MGDAADRREIPVKVGLLQGAPIALQVTEEQADELLQRGVVAIEQVAGRAQVGDGVFANHLHVAAPPLPRARRQQRSCRPSPGRSPHAARPA